MAIAPSAAQTPGRNISVAASADQSFKEFDAFCKRRDAVLNVGMSRTRLLRDLVSAGKWALGVVNTTGPEVDQPFEKCIAGLQRSVESLREAASAPGTSGEEMLFRQGFGECIDRLEAVHAAGVARNKPQAEKAFDAFLRQMKQFKDSLPPPAP